MLKLITSASLKFVTKEGLEISEGEQINFFLKPAFGKADHWTCNLHPFVGEDAEYNENIAPIVFMQHTEELDNFYMANGIEIPLFDNEGNPKYPGVDINNPDIQNVVIARLEELYPELEGELSII